PRLGPAVPGAEGARAALPRRATTEQTTLQAMGALLYARRLVEAFREAITHWWEAGGDADGRNAQGLFTVCRSFEISVEVLPRVDTGESGPGARAGGGVEEVLTGLAEQVWFALRDGLSAEPGGAAR
ncbi:hypothetical protein ACWEGQ_35095, partial [Streptomyces seoulensis]